MALAIYQTNIPADNDLLVSSVHFFGATLEQDLVSSVNFEIIEIIPSSILLMWTKREEYQTLIVEGHH